MLDKTHNDSYPEYHDDRFGKWSVKNIPFEPLSKWIHDSEMPYRSTDEINRRINGAKLITRNNLNSNFYSTLKEVGSIYEKDSLDTKNQAVLGVMSGLIDLHLYVDELLIFRKFTGLPVSSEEFHNLWDRMHFVHPEKDFTVRKTVRKEIRNSLWDGVNKSIEQSKSKFEIRPFCGDDVNDLEKGLKKGVKSLLNQTKDKKFIFELNRLGLISDEQKKVILSIKKEISKDDKTKVFPESEDVRNRIIDSFYEPVFIGNCKTLQECDQYFEDKRLDRF